MKEIQLMSTKLLTILIDVKDQRVTLSNHTKSNNANINLDYDQHIFLKKTNYQVFGLSNNDVLVIRFIHIDLSSILEYLTGCK